MPRQRGVALKDTSLRRFRDHKPVGRPKTLDTGHEAVTRARTLYWEKVLHPSLASRLLKSGHHSRKIGRRVQKGRWRGFEIYTLTLEERATCPEICRHWRDCYGNKMHWSDRLQHGPELEWRLERELQDLQARHPEGFVVRLHVLGDFYSPAYVFRWIEWLERYPALHVFGYTAWPPDSVIGSILNEFSRAWWHRFAIRFSNQGLSERGAVSLYVRLLGEHRVGGALVCPAQTGKTACCATCALCWGTKRNIAFLVH